MRFHAAAWLPLAGLVAALTGCATAPPQPLAPSLVPNAFEERSAATAPVWPEQGWWRQFQSPELSSFIARAQADNRDLGVAAARFEEATAQVTVQRAALFPTVDAQAQAQRSRSGAILGSSNGQSTVISPGYTGNSFGLNVDATYDLDVWSLARDNLRSAKESAKSARFAERATALTVTSGVADGYFSVLSLREQIAIADEEVRAINGILAIIKLKVSAGTASHLDLAQEQAQEESVQAEIPVLNEAEFEARITLAVLLGRPPESFEISAQSTAGIKLPEVAAGPPSQLLLRRPDVAEAEANLAAAHANLQAARAAFLPQFSLTGSRGFSSAIIGTLLRGPNVVWDAGGQILQTIFAGGKLVGEKNLAYATQKELVAAYESAVLKAYADVEAALGEVRNDALEEQHLEREVAAAREAFNISELQYRQGVADLLNVLQAQQTLFEARDALAQARLARMQATVHLYTALGGGWQEPQRERTQFIADRPAAG